MVGLVHAHYTLVIQLGRNVEILLQESRKSGSAIGVRGKFGVPGLFSEGGELHAPIFE